MSTFLPYAGLVYHNTSYPITKPSSKIWASKTNSFRWCIHMKMDKLAELAKKVILNGIKKKLKEAKGWRAKELISVLSYGLIIQPPDTSIGETPFKLVYWLRRHDVVRDQSPQLVQGPY